VLPDVDSPRQRSISFLDATSLIEFGIWLGITTVSPGVIGAHFAQFTHLAGMPRSSHSFFKVIWFACVWAI